MADYIGEETPSGSAINASSSIENFIGSGTVYVLKVFDRKGFCEGRLLFDSLERLDSFLNLTATASNRVSTYEKDFPVEVDSFIFSKVKAKKTFFVFNSFFESSLIKR